MATEAEILAVLTGTKVLDAGMWRVYDGGGTELADPGGVLWRGVHGALLWNANNAAAEAVVSLGGPAKHRHYDTIPRWAVECRLSIADGDDTLRAACLVRPMPVRPQKVIVRKIEPLPVDPAPAISVKPAQKPYPELKRTGPPLIRTRAKEPA